MSGSYTIDYSNEDTKRVDSILKYNEKSLILLCAEDLKWLKVNRPDIELVSIFGVRRKVTECLNEYSEEDGYTNYGFLLEDVADSMNGALKHE